MKKIMSTAISATLLFSVANAQNIKTTGVPSAAKTALEKKYPTAKKVTWEKEKRNLEANWGGRSGEDMSVQFSPAGVFIEQVEAIKVSTVPASIDKYVKMKYHGAKISEAGKVTDSKGNHYYEAEVKGQDLIFDEKGNFVKKD